MIKIFFRISSLRSARRPPLYDPYPAQVALGIAPEGVVLDATDEVRRQDGLPLDVLHLGGDAMEAWRADPRVVLVLGVVDVIEVMGEGRRADEVVDRRHRLGRRARQG